MLIWLKENRLKISSSLCVLADMFMGLAGAAGLYHLGTNLGDVLLTIAGGLGLLGHSVNIIWGKGGRAKENRVFSAALKTYVHPLLKPFFIWRYPLDSSFAIFTVASLAFAISGAISDNPSLVVFGCITLVASLLGWLWPQNKTLYGFRSVQICALLYMVSGFVCLISGIWAQEFFIILAGCCYVSANTVLYTVRKENQSLYTVKIND